MSGRAHRYRAAMAIVRTPAFWVAAAAHVAVLAAFLLVWGDGIPSLTGSVLDQTLAVQAMTLAVLLPWVAVRCRPLSHPAVVRLAAVTFRAPSRLVMARAAAMAAALAGFALAGLPLLLLALQISETSFSGMMIPAAPVVAMIPFVAILATWCELLIARRLTVWLVATGVTVAIGLLPGLTAAVLFGTGAAAGVAALGGIGDRVLRQPAPPVMRTRHV